MQTRSVVLSLGLLLAARPLVCATAAPVPDQEPGCIVSRVVDGDTFYCRDGRKVRLIGVDSPEQQQGPIAAGARQALLRMLPPGALVRLERDVRLTDRYGRVLAYAWTGFTLVNEAMVLDGWAVLYTVPPNVKYAERFSQAQRKARAGGAGLWTQRGFDCLPADFRRSKCLSRP